MTSSSFLKVAQSKEFDKLHSCYTIHLIAASNGPIPYIIVRTGARCWSTSLALPGRQINQWHHSSEDGQICIDDMTALPWKWKQSHTILCNTWRETAGHMQIWTVSNDGNILLGAEIYYPRKVYPKGAFPMIPCSAVKILLYLSLLHSVLTFYFLAAACEMGGCILKYFSNVVLVIE